MLHIKNKRQGNKHSFAMIFKKNWQYTKLLNYYMLILKEKGLMDKLNHPYLISTKKSCPDQQLIRRFINKPKPVGVNTTVSSYLIVIGGCICALLVFAFEKLYY